MPHPTRRNAWISGTALLIAAAALAGGPAQADPGPAAVPPGRAMPGRSLVQRWNDGKAFVSPASGSIRDASTARDGSTAVVTTESIGGTSRWRVQRLTPSGDVDTSFGRGGVVYLRPRNQDGYALGVATWRNRTLVLGSDGDSGFAVARLRADGSPDATFGSRGIAFVPVTTSAIVSISAIEVLGNGKVLVLGNLASITSHLRTSSFVARLDRSGKLDGAFGRGGISVVDVTSGETSQNLTSFAVDPDGRIVVAGSRIVPPASQDMVAVRLRSGGQRDGGFANGGVFATQLLPGTVNAFSGVATRGDGSIVLSGWANPGGFANPDVTNYLVQLTKGGRWDARFSGDGKASLKTPVIDTFATTGMLPLADGGAVLGLSPLTFDAQPSYLVRITQGGTLRTTFGSRGYARMLLVDGERTFINQLVGDDKGVLAVGGSSLGSSAVSGGAARFPLG